jgi:hypothetical protein
VVYESKMWACKKWNCLYSIVHKNCLPIVESSGQVVEDKKKTCSICDYFQPS